MAAELKDGLRENPSWIAFALEDGTVYHTYTVAAPDPFVAPYFSALLDRTPKAQPAEPRSWRKGGYEVLPVTGAAGQVSERPAAVSRLAARGGDRHGRDSRGELCCHLPGRHLVLKADRNRAA